MNNARLQLTSISKTFTHNNTKTSILNDIHITFTQGMSYAITGASGVGKSTLLHIIAGLDAPTSGSLFFNDINIYTQSAHALSSFLNTKIGCVFQSTHMIKELSVVENVMLPGLIGNKKDLKKIACLLLEKVGLANKIESPPGELSGGQQQRAALARALINKPLFLIADEPTGNLDAETSSVIIDLILHYHHEWKMGLIISSHDHTIVQKMNLVLELTRSTLIQQPTGALACFQQKKFSHEQYK